MDKDQKITVNSPIGNQDIDSTGSPVGIVRMDSEKSYADTGDLLQKYIDEGDQTAWETIKSKIEYTYQSLNYALQALDVECRFSEEIQTRLKKGQNCFSNRTRSGSKPSIRRPMGRDRPAP